MKVFLLGLLLLSFSNAFALSDAEINKSLDQMEKSGVFTKEQIKAAREKFNNLSPEEKNTLIEKGKEEAEKIKSKNK